jgi:hypothetical protein
MPPEKISPMPERREENRLPKTDALPLFEVVLWLAFKASGVVAS